MKTNNGPSKGLIFIILLTILISISLVGYYTYKNYITYKSIEVSIKKNVIEYGNANYDLKEIVDKVDGEIVSIKKSIDTNTIGKQNIVVEVEKDSVSKDVLIEVEVVDTIAPEITLKEDKLSFEDGVDINLLDNISGVVDAIDGEIEYKDIASINEDMTNYYTISVDGDISSVGEHVVYVKAVDKYGNVSEKSFTVVVKAKVVPTFSEVVYDDLPAFANGDNLVNIAYSLIGSPYVAGGAYPGGFDCSGFVQYVYAQTGVSISRSSYTQVHDGVAVSYQSAKPGDIISWGYGNTVTHSALYVGNGMMIHAANPTQGVILSSVNDWLRGSGSSILSVRRII